MPFEGSPGEGSRGGAGRVQAGPGFHPAGRVTPHQWHPAWSLFLSHSFMEHLECSSRFPKHRGTLTMKQMWAVFSFDICIKRGRAPQEHV